MITIQDNDLPITVAQKLICGTKGEGDTPLNPDMFSQEELKEIAKYLLTYDMCHPKGD